MSADADQSLKQKAAGANALQAGKLAVITSLISGASSTGSKWVQWKTIS